MPIKRSADQVFVREVNLSLVLRQIHDEMPTSRAQIAVLTGLNKSTVSSLVDDLLRKGLIRENGVSSSGAGRPATLLEINPDAGSVIGVQWGGDFIAVALTNFLGEIRWRRTLVIKPTETQDDVLLHTLSLVNEAIDICKKRKSRLLGLGISVPGIVDTDHGVLIYAPSLKWRNVPLRKIFSEQTGLDTFVENDANAAAIAEHLFGAARRMDDFIFVFAGVGIGGGLFLSGKLYRGKNGFAGEIGHTQILTDSPAEICHCGNRGCWETFANQSSILHRAQARMDAKPGGMMPKIMSERNSPLTIPIVRQAAEAGDEDAIACLVETGTAMGQGFVGLINTFTPQMVILGGPLSAVGGYLLPTITDYVAYHSFNEFGAQVQVLLSSFAEDASLIGGTAVVVDDILNNPTRLERR